MSASLQFPSTPAPTYHSQRNGSRSYTHKPANSSPLAGASSSPGFGPNSSSPIAAVQARRRSQYKAHGPPPPRSVSGSNFPLASLSLSSSGSRAAFTAGPDAGDESDSQKAFLRTRLKLRCIERASKARARAVQRKRVYMSSSDDMDMDMAMGGEEDSDGDDEEFDELFSRIMKNTTRKMHHAFMYSYDREVGSDPVPDVDEWENELAGRSESATVPSTSTYVNANSTPREAELEPEELEELEDDAELRAYLADQAAFADFADIPAEELFAWGEGEDDDEFNSASSSALAYNSVPSESASGADAEMDTS
ncbi:hypothetical protein B0H11DRAFT_2197445 [Mycena galericulata]|nr:hypothetical protein B0H11DRAFT_2197445 [Mycena galericulata]